MGSFALADQQDRILAREWAYRAQVEADVLIHCARLAFPDDSPHRVLATAGRTCRDMLERRPIRRWRLNELERLMAETSAECLRRTGSPGCGTVRL